MLVHANFASIKLYKWVDFSFSKCHRSLVKRYSQAPAILIVFNDSILQVNFYSNNIAYRKQILVIHILDVLWEISAEFFSIKHVEDPIIFFLILDNSIFIEIKVLSAEANTHFDAAGDRHWNSRLLRLIVAFLYFKLVIITILHVVVVYNCIISHCFATWLPFIMVCGKGLNSLVSFNFLVKHTTLFRLFVKFIDVSLASFCHEMEGLILLWNCSCWF